MSEENRRYLNRKNEKIICSLKTMYMKVHYELDIIALTKKNIEKHGIVIRSGTREMFFQVNQIKKIRSNKNIVTNPKLQIIIKSGSTHTFLFEQNQRDDVARFVNEFKRYAELDFKIEAKEKAMAKAIERETAKDYESAIRIWEKLGNISEAARIRELQADFGSVKVAQKVVHGDDVTKTEIKDSVLNRSNVGGGSSKMQELKDLTAMKKDGLIDDDEFKQMKKEILGK